MTRSPFTHRIGILSDGRKVGGSDTTRHNMASTGSVLVVVEEGMISVRYRKYIHMIYTKGFPRPTR